MKKYLILLGLLQCYALVQAQNSSVGITMPYSGQVSSGQDRIRSADGVECSRSVGAREKWVELGTFASRGTGQGSETTYSSDTSSMVTTPDYRKKSVGVYGKIIISLDSHKPDIDCSKLYEVEIMRLRKELEESQLKSKGPQPYTGN